MRNVYVKKILISFFVVLTVLLAAYLIYNSLTFRVTGTSPRGNIIPDSSEEIVISYNKNLAENSRQPKSLVSIYPAKFIQYETQENKLIIKLSSPFRNGDKVKLSVRGIVSEGGEELKLSNFNYVAKYVSFNKLDAQQKNIQTDSSIITVEENPFLAKLPYGSTENITDSPYFLVGYKVSGDVGNSSNWKSKKDNYCVVITTNAQDYYEEGTRQFIGLTRRLRYQALEWIKGQGAQPGIDINYKFEPSSNSPGLEYDPPESCK
jgi:hypothetical protein